MPVYRDSAGGIGTPTSDHERTKLTLGTTHLLTIMNSYSGPEGLEEKVDFLVGLLKEYAEATDLQIVYFH